MGIIHRKKPLQLDNHKQAQIEKLEREASHNRGALKKLRSISTDNLSKSELYQHNRTLMIELRKKEVLKNKLANLGVTEKRGRPKKEADQLYKNRKIKFTAMLDPGNLEYLRTLKDSGAIHDISSFLDDLICGYKNSDNTKK